MSRSRFKLSFFVFVFTLGLVVQAQDYPSYQNLYVNDYASVISETDAAQLHNLLQTFRAETGREVTVLTVDSYLDYGTGDSSLESFATNLFNTWGIGDATKNDGALVLVAVQDRELRVELGRGYDASYDRIADLVIDEYMVPHFRRDDYSGGIVRGTRELVQRLNASADETLDSSSVAEPFDAPPVIDVNPPAPTFDPSPNYDPAPSYDPYPSYESDGGDTTPFFLGGLVSLALGGGAAYTLLQRRRRFKPRDCQNCDHALERLDELNDDVYLDDGQQAEEFLRSVDYDVWKCHNCNEHELHRYPALFSGYHTCPSCDYRTLQINRKTLVAATCHSGGRQEVTKDCRNDKCSYKNSHIVNTPARNCDDNNSSSSFSSSSSSSSSSFGGGSSSGGGSSGSW